MQLFSVVEALGVDPVLQARLGLLRSSLLTVESAIERIEDARRPSSPADSSTSALLSLSRSVSATLTSVRDFLNSIEGTCDVAATREVLRHLEAARDAAKVTAPLAGPHLVLEQTSVGSDLQEDVVDRSDELDEIEALVRSAADKGEEEREELLNRAWKDFVDVEKKCESVFEEYVDLVRGVLLRDAGLDRDLCRIADELLRPWGRISEYDWRSFTIPASRDWGRMSAARLIRLGFPEWSIWSLPLTAHEFGHLFASKHRKMELLTAEIKKSGWASSSDVRIWIADVFATVTMGPAYVWATMLLRADPSSQLDNERVTIMLESLRAIAPGGEYNQLCATMEDAWRRASAHVVVEGSGGRDRQDLIAMIVTPVHKRVKDPFKASAWERATELVDKLEDPALKVSEVIDGLGWRDLPHLLVAAWYARLRVPSYPGAPAETISEMERDRIQGLAERTREACIAVTDQRIPSGQAETRAPRGAETAPVEKPPAAV